MPFQNNYSIISNPPAEAIYTLQPTNTLQANLEKAKAPLPIENILKKCLPETANNLPNNVFPEQFDTNPASYSIKQTPISTVIIERIYITPPPNTIEFLEKNYFELTDIYRAQTLLERLVNCCCCCFTKSAE